MQAKVEQEEAVALFLPFPSFFFRRNHSSRAVGCCCWVAALALGNCLSVVLGCCLGVGQLLLLLLLRCRCAVGALSVRCCCVVGALSVRCFSVLLFLGAVVCCCWRAEEREEREREREEEEEEEEQTGEQENKSLF